MTATSVHKPATTPENGSPHGTADLGGSRAQLLAQRHREYSKNGWHCGAGSHPAGRAHKDAAFQLAKAQGQKGGTGPQYCYSLTTPKLQPQGDMVHPALRVNPKEAGKQWGVQSIHHGVKSLDFLKNLKEERQHVLVDRKNYNAYTPSLALLHGLEPAQ